MEFYYLITYLLTSDLILLRSINSPGQVKSSLSETSLWSFIREGGIANILRSGFKILYDNTSKSLFSGILKSYDPNKATCAALSLISGFISDHSHRYTNGRVVITW